MSCVIDKLPKELKELHKLGILCDLDLYLVESLLRRHNATCAAPAAQLALALASRAVGQEHVCLELSSVTPEWIAGLNTDRDAGENSLPEGVAGLAAAIMDSGRRDELFSSCGGVVGSPSADSPFVLDGNRLYLRRYWGYERQVAGRLAEMAKAEVGTIAAEAASLLEQIIDREEKRPAARMALTRRLTVVTGGPGTGKTFLAARILALLAHGKRPGGRPLRIRTAAPTGKAAARMDDSLRDAIRKLEPAICLQDALIEPACTMERLLGFITGSPYFRYNAENPLPADVVLIDEASMVDIAKMAKLLEALPREARLVLFGDMHQLASVQPGSVLAEICESAAIKHCVARLTGSERFGPETPVGKLSISVNGADSDEKARAAWNLMKDSGIQQHDTPDSLIRPTGEADAGFAKSILAGYVEFLGADTPEKAFEALARFRVLCALRRGLLGAVKVNSIIEDILSLRTVRIKPIEEAGLLPKRKLDPRQEFYSHRVVMVTKNDYAINLFNGDVGVVLPDKEAGGELVAFFERTGKIAQGESRFRKVSRRLLPEHETAFAMTIHKSQGSEFESVLVLLPNKDNPVLTKELIYTAITRAKNHIEIWCTGKIFQKAIMRKVERASGLGDALRKKTGIK